MGFAALNPSYELTLSSLRKQGPITTGPGLATERVTASAPITEIARYGSRLCTHFVRLAGTTLKSPAFAGDDDRCFGGTVRNLQTWAFH